MKAKNKLLALALSALTGVSAFGLGLHLALPRTVSADSTTEVPVPTATNLEDLVNDGSDIRWVYNSEGMHSPYAGRQNEEENIINKGKQDASNGTKNYIYAIYNTAYDENDATQKLGEIKYQARRIPEGGTTATITEVTDPSVIINANKYKGNYSFFANEETSASGLQNGGVYLAGLDDEKPISKDQIISFNMNFADRRYDFYSRWVQNFNSKGEMVYYANPSSTNGSYYGVLFNLSNTAFISFRNKVANVSTDAAARNNSAIRIAKSTVVDEYNAAYGTNYTVAQFDESVLVKGQTINVTYGTFDYTGNTYTYFKLLNVDTGKVIFERTVLVGQDTVDYDGSTAEGKTYDSNILMKVEFQSRTDWDRVGADRMPITIAGVTEPLLANKNYDTTVAEDPAYIEGKALSTVTTLPADYEWKNPNEVLKEGEHEYEAIYKYETAYYNVTEKACKVTVKAGPKPGYSLTLKDLKGNVIGTDTVPYDEGSYTFTDVPLNSEKKFIAYEAGGKLYNVGDTVEISANSEATLWETDFAIAETASVRLLDNQNGIGGIRWTMNIDAEDYEIIKNKVSLSTLMIPTDLIEGDLEVHLEAYKAAVEPQIVFPLASEKVVNGKADFALSNIQHFNYNRLYSGAAFMEVTYEGGATRKILAEQKDFSVYELALDALSKHYAQKGQDQNLPGLYNETDVALLETYIAGVIDLTVTETVTDEITNLKVVGTDGESKTLVSDFGYEVVEATQEKAATGKTTVALTITVTAGSVLDTLVQVGVEVPVIVRSAATPDEYKTVKAKATAYVDGTLTISVEI